MRNFLSLPLVLLIACGDDGGNKKIDAGPGGDDAPDIDAPLGPTGNVKITITSGTTPMVGVRVHFQNADSSLVASVDTDANGVASADMAAGGFVTAVNPFANAPGGTIADLKTYAGVKPGDELVLREDSGGAVDTVDFTTPTDNTAGVTQYGVATVCDRNAETTTTVQLNLYYKCQPTADVLIASLDANEDVVNYVFVPDVSTTGPTVDLSGQTLAAPTTKTFTFNNIPASGMGIEMDYGLHSSKGQLFGAEKQDTGTTVTHTLKVTPFTNAIESFLAVASAANGFHVLAEWGPFSATAYSTDVGARLLKEATTGASYDNATHKITWTDGATGGTPDFIQASTQTFRASAGLYVYWDLAAPYTSGEAKFPTLPVEGTDYNSQPNDVVSIDTMTLGKIAGGYDTIREIINALEGPEGLGGSGSIELEDIFDANMLLLAPMKGVLKEFQPRHPKNGLSARWQSRHRM